MKGNIIVLTLWTTAEAMLLLVSSTVYICTCNKDKQKLEEIAHLWRKCFNLLYKNANI